MSVGEGLLLLFAGMAAAGLNSVAGGGSFISYPALVFIGVDPVRANATSTFALWPAWFATGSALRQELWSERRLLLLLGIPCVVGSVVGALILVRTPSPTFVRILPFLLLAATLLFAFGDRLRTLGRGSREGPDIPNIPSGGVGLVQLGIAVYGGYFGGGMGLLMLALLALQGMTDLHRMNAVKSVLAVIINGFALATFAFTRSIDWRPGLVMAAGGMVGGYLGPVVARRVPPLQLRRFVVAVGLLMTALFFSRAYLR